MQQGQVFSGVLAGAVPYSKYVADKTQGPSFMDQAQQDLKLNPQERGLYARHIENLNGPGKVSLPDGSISTLFQMSVNGPGGKVYNIPTVYDGQIVNPDDAIKRAAQYGWNFFPSYSSADQAQARYQQMHVYMDKDVGNYIQQQRSNK